MQRSENEHWIEFSWKDTHVQYWYLTDCNFGNNNYVCRNVASFYFLLRPTLARKASNRGHFMWLGLACTALYILQFLLTKPETNSQISHASFIFCHCSALHVSSNNNCNSNNNIPLSLSGTNSTQTIVWQSHQYTILSSGRCIRCVLFIGQYKHVYENTTWAVHKHGHMVIWCSGTMQRNKYTLWIYAL